MIKSIWVEKLKMGEAKMATKIGINGFGRIGRLTLRTINQYYKDNLEVVAVNDLTDNKTNAHLLKWDSTYGQYKGTVTDEADGIIVDGIKIKVLAEKDPAKIAWKDYGVDIVIESTGRFTDATKAAAHLQGGAKKGNHLRAGQERRYHHRSRCERRKI